VRIPYQKEARTRTEETSSARIGTATNKRIWGQSLAKDSEIGYCKGNTNFNGGGFRLKRGKNDHWRPTGTKSKGDGAHDSGRKRKKDLRHIHGEDLGTK